MYQIDERKHHVMSSQMRGDCYVTLAWPKNLTVQELDWMEELVLLQINVFRKQARKETEAQEAARLEVESWSKHG